MWILLYIIVEYKKCKKKLLKIKVRKKHENEHLQSFSTTVNSVNFSQY